jgi:hypothetical protein
MTGLDHLFHIQLSQLFPGHSPSRSEGVIGPDMDGVTSTDMEAWLGEAPRPFAIGPPMLDMAGLRILANIRVKDLAAYAAVQSPPVDWRAKPHANPVGSNRDRQVSGS